MLVAPAEMAVLAVKVEMVSAVHGAVIPAEVPFMAALEVEVATVEQEAVVVKADKVQQV